jgi:protein gp37
MSGSMRPSRDTSLHALNCSGWCNRGESVGTEARTVQKEFLDHVKNMYRAFTAREIFRSLSPGQKSYNEMYVSRTTRVYEQAPLDTPTWNNS